MANEEHIEILRQGVASWNIWRKDNSDEPIDLSGVNLRGANLCNANLNSANLADVNLEGAKLREADLVDADLSVANLFEADLMWAKLSHANFIHADLRDAHLPFADLSQAYLYEADLVRVDFLRANLSQACLHGAILEGADLFGSNLYRADLTEANLFQANLSEANLSEADLSGSNLINAILVDATLDRANLTNCNVHGVSAWGLKLNGTTQKNLRITPVVGFPAITVDNLEVAQFIYLLLYNEKIRDVIDTVAKKVVLVLGSFLPEQRVVLDAIKERLRKLDYLPVVFDFPNSESRDLIETVSLLAHMSRFIIADLTNAHNIIAELICISERLPSVPIQPLLFSSQNEYATFEHIRVYHSVLRPYHYETLEELLAAFDEKIIAPAESKVDELWKERLSQ